jgi:hypothetical protein
MRPMKRSCHRGAVPDSLMARIEQREVSGHGSQNRWTGSNPVRSPSLPQYWRHLGPYSGMRLGVHDITAAHLVNVDDDHHHPSVEPMGSHWGGRADRDRDLSVPWRNTSRCAHHRLFSLAELPERPRNDCDPWRPVEPRWCWRIYREFRTSCTLHRGLRSCVHEDPFDGAPRAPLQPLPRSQFWLSARGSLARPSVRRTYSQPST